MIAKKYGISFLHVNWNISDSSSMQAKIEYTAGLPNSMNLCTIKQNHKLEINCIRSDGMNSVPMQHMLPVIITSNEIVANIHRVDVVDPYGSVRA